MSDGGEKKHIAVGLFLTALSILALIFGYRACTAISEVGSELKSELNKQRPKPSQCITISNVRGYIKGDYMHLEGKITNSAGTETFRNVKIRVEWFDKNGRMLDTDYTYAVGPEGLRPGATKSFKIMTPTDNNMANYNYYIMDD